MSKDLVSIIIAVYNGADCISECVGSILESSYKKIEVILVNDGSVDNSEEICLKLSEKDNRVKYYSKENGGIADARNYGLKRAKGEYICFADQDDTVPEYAYELMKSDIENNNADICIGNFATCSQNRIIPKYTFKDNFFIEKEENVQQYLIEMMTKWKGINYCNTNGVYSWTLWNNMFKKEIINKNAIEIKKIVNFEDDLLFNFNYLKHVDKIIFEKEIVYFWRKNLKSESNSKKYVQDLYENRKILIDYVCDNMKDIKGFDEEKWRFLSYEHNFVDAIINEANTKNERNPKDSIQYLEKIYNQDIANKDFQFICKKSPFKEKFTKCYDVTYKCCKNGRYKLAFYIDRYLYGKFIFKIVNIARRDYYR